MHSFGSNTKTQKTVINNSMESKDTCAHFSLSLPNARVRPQPIAFPTRSLYITRAPLSTKGQHNGVVWFFLTRRREERCFDTHNAALLRAREKTKGLYLGFHKGGLSLSLSLSLPLFSFFFFFLFLFLPFPSFFFSPFPPFFFPFFFPFFLFSNL